MNVPEKFQIPEGLTPDTIATLERIRIMARKRVLAARDAHRAKSVQVTHASQSAAAMAQADARND